MANYVLVFSLSFALEKCGVSEQQIDNIVPLVQIGLSFFASKVAAKRTTNNTAKNTVYRTMEEGDFIALKGTGKLSPGKGETMISPTESFAKNYNGVTVKFRVSS